MQLLILFFKFFLILFGIINFSSKSPAKPPFENIKAITYFLTKENFKKEILDNLEQENSLLYLISHYDERDFRKDLIRISMYYVDGKQIPSVGKTHQMIAVDSVRMLKKPDGFKNISYQSTYNIKKSELHELYKKFENDSELEYFVIKPDYYEQDKRFLSYEIYPADSKWKKLELPSTLAEKTRLDPSPPAIRN